MNVQTLLDQAAQCKTDDDAHKLVLAMQEAFTAGNGPLSNLPVYNPDWTMEDTGPFARFELNREISEYYITMVRPEIRNGEFVIVIITNYMRDGLGMQSRDYDTVEGIDEEVLEGSPEREVNDLAQRAVELAVAQHRQLIERMGVPEAIAQEAAQKCWPQ